MLVEDKETSVGNIEDENQITRELEYMNIDLNATGDTTLPGGVTTADWLDDIEDINIKLRDDTQVCI